MPSFDITSEVDMVALKNAVDVASRQIATRYDFKGTSAAVELNEKDKEMTLLGDSDFQLDQVKAILLPAMEKKEPDSAKATRSSAGAKSLRQQGKTSLENSCRHRRRVGQKIGEID
jgi:uncharacterized protein YajQ (UPF0234 family)